MTKTYPKIKDTVNYSTLKWLKFYNESKITKRGAAYSYSTIYCWGREKQHSQIDRHGIFKRMLILIVNLA
jgi:hypothetical protein